MLLQKNSYHLIAASKSFKNLVVLYFCISAFQGTTQIVLHKIIGNNITPKSIVSDGRGLFSAQNMMYKHSVTLYSAQGILLKSIPDKVNLNQYGFAEYEDAIYKGAPVEACFTPNGKYLWVSNYAMYGPGFDKEGCDGCSGDSYDPSFLYKINTINFQIESVVKVGSVPKYLTISNNGKLLLVSNWTSSDVSIIDLETEKEIKRVKVGSRPRGVVVDKLNQRAYVAIMGSDKIAVINLLNYQVSYIPKVGRGPRHLILNAQNSFLYVASNSANKLVKINLKTKKQQICKTNSGPRSMVLSANEKFLYVVNYYANTFQKINAESMTVIETVKTFQKPIGIAGDWVLGNIWVSCYSGKIQIFNDVDLPALSAGLEVEMETKPQVKLADLIVKPSNIISRSEIEPMPTKKTSNASLTSNTKKVNGSEQGTFFENELVTSAEKYAVVVGSFSVEKNAKKFQALLVTQNFTPTLLSSSNGKMTMVSVGSFADSEQAQKTIKTLKSTHNLNAWIYERNQ